MGGQVLKLTTVSMGLFSFLKKKNDAVVQPGWPPPESRLRGEPSRLDSEAERERQRDIARATAAKIDEIELAFASDMFDDEPAWDSGGHRPANGVAAPSDPDDIPDQAAAPASAPAVDESAILYANGQAAAAEQLLRESLPTLGHHERLPCFCEAPGLLVLPAFGAFTGSTRALPATTQRCYAIGDGQVVALPWTGRGR